MKKTVFIGIILVMTALLYSCVKDLHNSGISESTVLKGRMLEESEREPLVGIMVTVTNGTTDYANTKTNDEGRFELTVNYFNIGKGYYLYFDSGSSGITKTLELKGMGQETYDYLDVFLYNKNNGAAPTISTNSVKDITINSALCGGVITSDGGFEITQRGLCWSTLEAPSITDLKVACGTGVGEFTGVLSGLSSNTKYYVRAYASNAIGTSYGEQRSFTTAGSGGEITKPTVTTNPVSDITTNTASCGGNVTSDGGATVTERGVCWSVNPNPTTSNSVANNGTGTGSYTCTMSNLSANTKYYVRAYATNSQGTSYGDSFEFITSSGGGGYSAPTVVTGVVTNITTSSASCSASVTSDGGASVSYRGVCWGTSPNPIPDFYSSSNTALSGQGTGTYICEIDGLSPNTTYHVRAFAGNQADTSYGEDVVFKTLDNINTPDINTLWVKEITNTSAECTGYVYTDGGAEVTDRGIQWSTTSSFVNYSVSHSGSGEGMFTCVLSELSPNTTYYFRAFAANIQGTGYGQTKSFMTLGGKGKKGKKEQEMDF